MNKDELKKRIYTVDSMLEDKGNKIYGDRKRLRHVDNSIAEEELLIELGRASGRNVLQGLLEIRSKQLAELEDEQSLYSKLKDKLAELQQELDLSELDL
jgi:uncharacterized protein involved in exopolysaccharide biosynthesis